MYKTEMHAHTSEVSKCSRLTANELVKLYSEAGYDTLFISDHFITKYFDKLGDIPWEEKVDMFFTGYEAAREAGKEYGINVLPSLEIALAGSKNHYLLYCASREFLKKSQDIFNMSTPEFYAYCKTNGITVVQAHPLRDLECSPTIDSIDALEVINSCPRKNNYNDRVIKLAKENGIPMTAGADTHRPEDVGLTGLLTEEEIKSPEDYVEMLMNNKLQIIYDAEYDV